MYSRVTVSWAFYLPTGIKLYLNENQVKTFNDYDLTHKTSFCNKCELIKSQLDNIHTIDNSLTLSSSASKQTTWSLVEAKDKISIFQVTFNFCKKRSHRNLLFELETNVNVTW